MNPLDGLSVGADVAQIAQVMGTIAASAVAFLTLKKGSRQNSKKMGLSPDAASKRAPLAKSPFEKSAEYRTRTFAYVHLLKKAAFVTKPNGALNKQLAQLV